MDDKKLNEADQGLTMLVSVHKKVVIIEFDRSLSWIGMDKFEALHLSEFLRISAQKVIEEENHEKYPYN